MADLQKTIEIVFLGTDRTDSAVTSVGKGLRSVEDNVGSVTGPLASIADTALKTEAAIVTMAAAAAGFAINEAGKFRDAVSETGTLFNGSAEQVRALGDEILAYSKTSTAAIDEINASAYKAISTGTDYADAVSLVSQAEVLATAGRANLADTTSVLTASLNAYGDTVLQAADYSDTLFVAVQTGNTTLPELASNLGKVTALGNAAGVPFDDLAASLSALTITAGSTAESSTLLKALLSELVDPSTELSDALGDVSIKSDGLDGVLRKLFEATNGEAEKMSELFGSTRAMQGALILATDASGAFEKALAAQADRTGVAAEANEVMSKSFESVNQNLLNNISVTFVGIGDQLLDEYKDIAKGIASVFGGISTSIDSGTFDEVFKALDAAGIDITAKLQGIAEALPAALDGLKFEGLIEAFALLGEEIGDLFGGLDLTKSEDLAKALQFIVDSIESLTRVSAGVVAGLQPLFEIIGRLVTEINSAEGGTKNLVGELLGFGRTVDTLLPALGGLGDILATVGGGLAVIGGAKSAGVAVSGMTSLTAALAGGAGVTAALGAAGAAGYSLGAAIEDLTGIGSKTGAWVYDLVNGTTTLGSAQAATATAIQKTTESKNAASEADQALAESSKKLADVINRDANLSFEEQVDRLEKNADIKQKLAGINGEIASSEEDVAEAVGKARLSFDLLTEEEKKTLSTQEKVNLAVQRYAEKSSDVEIVNGKLKKTTADVADATDQQAKALERNQEQIVKAAEAAQKYDLELEKLASNERLQALEFEFKLDLAELEAESERAKAVIESIGTTVESTGSTIDGLFSTLASGDLSRLDQLDLERQIDSENDRRDKALEDQSKLVSAQTELVNQQAKLAQAKARAVRDGDYLIKVEAEGLTPALDIVFNEILKYAQVRATQEGAEFLIGL